MYFFISNLKIRRSFCVYFFRIKSAHFSKLCGGRKYEHSTKKIRGGFYASIKISCQSLYNETILVGRVG